MVTTFFIPTQKMFCTSNKLNLFLIIIPWTILTPVVFSKKLWQKIYEQEDDAYNIVMNIVKSCSANDAKPLLLAGQFNDIEIYNFLSFAVAKQQLVLFDNLNLTNRPSNGRVSTYKVDSKLTNHYILFNSFNTLIISASSPNYLENLLIQVKESPWWYRLQNTVIFNKYLLEDNSCSEIMASKYLLIAWKMDLLNSIFICSISRDSIIILTYNPYTNWAPNSWKIVKEVRDNKRWTLYKFKYQPGSIECDTLYFDKTRRLDQFSIKAADSCPENQKIYHNIKHEYDQNIINLIANQLNATFNSEPWYNTSGGFNLDGDSEGIDEVVANNSADILLQSRYMVYSKGVVQITSTLGLSYINFITYNQGRVSILIEIITFFRPIVILLSLIVLGVTIAVLKISIHESFGNATIEVFRLFFNGPLLRVPNKLSPRIFLSTVLIFILIMQAILRSKLGSFITAPKSDNIESFSDLERFQDFKIYCTKGFEYPLPENLKKRCVIEEWFKIDLNTSDHKIAVIGENLWTIELAHKHFMHHSEEGISEHHLIYRMRRNWPLATRVIEITSKIFESGISYYFKNKVESSVAIKGCDHSKRHKHEAIKILNLSDLGFAFGILMFGLNCSLVCFLIEIKFWKLWSADE